MKQNTKIINGDCLEELERRDDFNKGYNKALTDIVEALSEFIEKELGK